MEWKGCFLSPGEHACDAQIGVIDELKRKWYTQLAECPTGLVSARTVAAVLLQCIYTSTSSV